MNSNNSSVGVTNIIYGIFLFTTSIMPFTTLFWDVNFYWIKGNWAPYPIFLIVLAFAILYRQRVPQDFTILIFIASFYLILAPLTGGDMDSTIRFTLAIMPLTFYFLFDSISDWQPKFFWRIYGALLMIPMYFSYMQITGKMPFSEFDYVDGGIVGRVSGGYLKPMNLIAFILPVFLLGFYLWRVKGRSFTGILIITLTFASVMAIGHRTSQIAFLIIFATFFLKKMLRLLIYTYYKYFLNFIVPILAFVSLRIMLETVGLLDKLRGRVAIWELHSWQFFDQNIFEILFGSQKVLIEDVYRHPSVVLNEEAHNNSFRTIIVFGLVGFFIYCIFIRKIVLIIRNKNYPNELEFILHSCFTYFIFYSITNEPLYYASVLWPILIWIFLAQSIYPKSKISIG